MYRNIYIYFKRNSWSYLTFKNIIISLILILKRHFYTDMLFNYFRLITISRNINNQFSTGIFIYKK